MRTIITLNKYGKRGRNLHEKFYSRSFTRGLIDQLYTGMANLQAASQFDQGKNLDKVYHPMSVYNLLAYSYYQQRHLSVASPGGDSAVLGMATSSTYQLPYHSVMGQDIGIMIGHDNDAETPTDWRLAHRIGHGYRAAEGSPALKNSYAGTDDTNFDINSTTFRYGQPFTPTHDYLLTSIKIKMWRTGSIGTTTIRIRGSYDGGALTFRHPSSTYCEELASATIAEGAIGTGTPGALVEATFSTPPKLYAGHTYWITIESAAAGGAAHLYLRYDTSNITTYCSGFGYDNAVVILSQIVQSANSGVTWTVFDVSGDDCMIYETYGQSIGDVEYAGCVVGNLVVSNPNASFEIRRFFKNFSGGTINVNEIGIGAACGRSSSFWYLDAHLIARDVLASTVPLLNDEILEVTYTPTITV